MKHIRNFEGFRIRKNREEIIRESVLQVNDIYKVKAMVDIPQSLINSYVKKVKDNTGKNLRQFFGDVDIAEEIVKFITLNNLDVEKIPGNALMGGAQGQPQGESEGQVQVQTETEPQAQTQDQPEAQPEGQPEAQPEGQVEPTFEEPQAQEEKEEGEEEKEEGEEEKEEGEEEKEEGEEEKEELPL